MAINKPNRQRLLPLVVAAILCFMLLTHRIPWSTSMPIAPFQTQFNYTRNLVIPALRNDSLSWMDEQMADLLSPAGNYSRKLYIVDDQTAEYHTIANKGNEAMAYLTYLIDFYDTFPDISTFIHGKDTEWHNNPLLNGSTSLMIRNLNLDKVAAEGYMNLRCNWDPGCPNQIHPYTTEDDYEKLEEVLFLNAWRELFQTDTAPEVLAQPCCSQFAVTRERLRAVPKAQYIHLRDWLVRTEMQDHDSGRILEYTWQYLWNGTATFCSDPRVCYCEAYGVCFDTPDGYHEFFELHQEFKCAKEDLEAWRQQKEEYDVYLQTVTDDQGTGYDDENPVPTHPKLGLDLELKEQCAAVEREMAKRQEAAWENGRDPWRRKAILERGWPPIQSLPRDSPECKRENEKVLAVRSGHE